jgi:putative acetyltransferase
VTQANEPSTPAAAFAIRPVRTEADVAAARELFVEYQAWSGVDLCFQSFPAELASLPGAYAPPSGRLLLAQRGPVIAGCIAMRALDGERCEMKRLFVRPEHHGLGLGRLLVTTLIAEAKAAGYRAMVLDTLPKMQAAQRLYESLGFHDIEDYTVNPIPGARWLGLDLETDDER